MAGARGPLHAERLQNHRHPSRFGRRRLSVEEIRDAVLKNWREAKAREIRERDYAERRKRFGVEIRRRDAPAAESR